MTASRALVETDSGRISVELEGVETAELVVVATGGPGVGHDHYHPWFSRLLPELRVGYLDYIGCGRSDRLADAAGYTIDRFAQDIEALRLHAGAETLSLVGMSFGGFPAVEYALSHPGRLRRLVLSNAHVSAEGWQRTNIDGVNAELARLFPAEWRELLALRERGVSSLDPRYQEIVGLVLEDLEWFDPLRRPRLRQAEPGQGFNQDVYEALVGEDPEWSVTGSLAGYDRSPELSRLPPTLVAGGRYDRLTPPAVALEIHDLLDPGARVLHIFERSAHRPWAEEPDEYFRVVKAFLTAGAPCSAGVGSLQP